MSQPGPDASKRNKKRKLKQSRPLLEQLPAVPAVENGQRKQHKNKRHQQQPQHHQGAAEQQQEQQQQAAQPDALSAGNSKFARALGSTDFHTREQGLQALSRWLLHRQSTSELDMLKLWKGIYFCFWHSDKEPVQEDLAERLSGLIPRMQPQMAVLYWAAMLSTLRAEWFALDRHRLNKFLMLVRKFVAAVLTRLAAANWDVSTIQSFTSNLPLVGCLIPASNTGRSLGLSYHLADVWLPELRKVVVAGGSSGSAAAPPAASLQALLEPFVGVLQQSGEAALINRIRESVFEGFVQDLSAAGAAAAAAGGAGGSSSSDEDEDDNSWAYCQLLDVQGYAAALFDRGAEAGVKARNREALYGVSKDLERVAGKRRKAAAAAAAAAAQAPTPQKQQQQPKKQKQRQQQQEQVVVAEQQQQGDKKAKKQKKQLQKLEEQQQQQEAELQQNGTAAEPPSSSAKKRKKQQQQQQQQPAVEAAEQATPGGSAHKHKKHHKQQQQQQQQEAEAAAGATTTTPASGSHKKHGNRHNAATTPRTSSKRGVKIDLKKNIFFEHGSAPPASTPPKAPTPLKSALKSAAVRLDARGRPAAAPGTAPAGAAKQRGSRVVVTPSSVPRLRASEFF